MAKNLATTTLSKPVFEIYSTTPPPIDLKFSPHHRQHLPPSLSNFQARRSSFAIFIAIVVVVVVLLPPCNTPVRGKTTPKNRNPHHFKQHHAHPDTKNNPNRLENFSLGISGPEKTNPQLSANSVVRLLSYNPPRNKKPANFRLSSHPLHPTPLPHLPPPNGPPPPPPPLESGALFCLQLSDFQSDHRHKFWKNLQGSTPPCHSNQPWT
jgi:hypothetical protein